MDIKRAVEKCCFFTHNVFEYKGFKKAIVGISGGLDSAVITAICSKSLNPENVYGFMLPYGEQHDIEDSKLVCDVFKINKEIIDIKPIVDAFPPVDKIRLGNLKARIRMTVLYDMSMKYNGLVVGTSNLTELMLGYFTLHGDGACALEPIGHLFKTEVRQIAKELGVPDRIITKSPSAGLWHGQTDEEEIGCSYETMDTILSHRLVPSFMKTDSLELITDVMDSIATELKMPMETVAKILARMQKNNFKSEPPTMLRR